MGLTDSSGSITDMNSYDSFGNPSNASFPTRYQFTGREFDSFSGLQYSRARFYDPQIGRFISEDPIGFAGGDVNLYGYVKNSPLKKKDPSGLDDGDMNPFPFIYPPADDQVPDLREFHRQQYNAGFLPENFQCGPSPFGLPGCLMRGPYFQQPYGANFKDGPCYNHDLCYQTSGSNKAQCDVAIHKEMMDECNKLGPGPAFEACKNRARIYFEMVSDQYWLFNFLHYHPGADAYRGAQAGPILPFNE